MTAEEREILNNAGRRNSHTLFTHISEAKMKKVVRCLKKHDKDSLNCFVSFNEKDVNFINKITSKFKEYQKIIVARAYVNTKILKCILDDCINDSLIDVSKDDAIVKETNRLLDIIYSADTKEIEKNIANFPEMNLIQLELELHRDLDLNILLINAENELLQRPINDYLSLRNPYPIKVFTNSISVATDETTLDGEVVTVGTGDFNLKTNLSSISLTK